MKILVETDNMTAYEVSRRRRARVAAMQELVRRLVDSCEEHDIELVLTHTPGVKLDRPDQTSRGDAVEEPRQRLGAELFGELAARYGPFTEYIGGERWHPQEMAQSAARVRLWLHPSHSTVGSALRLMTTRLREAGDGAEGVIVVPDDSSTQWWSMTRYFSVEGRIRAGAEIQESRIGQWCPARTRRDALILHYPRSAGSTARPLVDARGEAPEYCVTARGGPRLRLLPGAVVIRVNPGRSGGAPGAAGVRSTASGCWQLFEVLGSWPSVTAAGSWVKVTKLELVRETPSELRLRRGLEDFLDPTGVVMLGGALHELKEGRGKQEVVVKWPMAASLAERALAGAWEARLEQARARASDAGAGADAGRQAAMPGSAEAAGSPARAGARDRPASTPARGTPAAAPRGLMSWGWSLGAGRHELAGTREEAAWEEDPQEEDTPGHEREEPWDLLAPRVVMGLPMDSPGVWPTPHIRGGVTASRGVGAPGVADCSAAGGDDTETPAGRAGARQRGAGTIPSRVAAGGGGGDFDADGQAQGAYEQYEPQTGGQAAIRERAEELRRRLEEMSVGREPQKCSQRSLLCGGCAGPIVPGELMIAVGSGWSHTDAGCELAAEAQHQAQVRAKLRESSVRPSALGTSTGPKPAQSTSGHTVAKRAQELNNMYSSDRVAACMRCLAGDCGKTGDKLFCDSCERGIHRECGQLSKTASLGVMRCTECRMAEMRVTQPAGPRVIEMCAMRMITELSSRLESTAQGHLAIERMQADFLNSKLESGQGMAKPVDNAESFCALLEWIISAGRGNRLDSFLIAAPAYFKDTQRKDMTKTDSVMRTVRKMKEINPTKSLPKTTGTSELLRETLLAVEDLADTRYIATREVFALSFEAVSGARCGEVYGAQMGHGVVANGVRILTWVGGAGYENPPTVEDGEVFVEVTTETSKTKHGRCFSMVGTTKGPAKVELEASLRKMWEANGFPIVTRVEEGWKVEGPDYYVVQIPLMGVTVSETKMSNLRAWLGAGARATTVARVTEVRQELGSELSDKARSKEPKVEKMFINVLGGSKADPELKAAKAELRKLGIESNIAKGPLIFKTRGKTKGAMQDSVFYPQPLQVSSTYASLHRAIDAAYAKLKERDPDWEMRLGGDREEAHFAHNTWRRLAATTAQAAFQAKKCSKEDVDLHMGWQLRKHAKEMRLHYAERGARACRARMTEMI